MKIPKYLQKQAIQAIEPSLSVKDAAELMNQHNIGALAVTLDGQLVGLISERDIVQRVVATGLSPQETKVEAIMANRPISANTNHTVKEATQLMENFAIRHLPLVDEHGQLITMLSFRDIHDCWLLELKEENLTLAALLNVDTPG